MNTARRFLWVVALCTALAGCASPAKEPDDGGYVENKTTEKTERQKGRVEGKVDERLDQETDEAVDGVLDGLLEKIFN